MVVVQALLLSLIGNPVKVGDGPAAVIGDEHRWTPLSGTQLMSWILISNNTVSIIYEITATGMNLKVECRMGRRGQ
jgi:hypothetical protein